MAKESGVSISEEFRRKRRRLPVPCVGAVAPTDTLKPVLAGDTERGAKAARNCRDPFSSNVIASVGEAESA